MTHKRALPDSAAVRRPRLPTWLVYVLFGGLLLAVLTGATVGLFRQAPNRDATTDLGPYGLVTIRFSTNPNPPLPTGTVTLSFMPMDSRQLAVALDSLAFEYGRAGDLRPVGAGAAQRMPDGSGMFMGSAQFPEVGNWWLRARLTRGDAQAEVRFMFYVEPAQ